MNYDFDNPWSMDRQECEWLTNYCIVNGIMSAIEFGPGNSTLALIDGGVLNLFTFEQDRSRCAEMEKELLSTPACVYCYEATDCPIQDWFPLDLFFDIALIDGPTGSSVTPPRINSAMYCYHRCDRLIFHDSKRDFETIKILIDLGMEPEDSLDSSRGIVVLKQPYL